MPSNLSKYKKSNKTTAITVTTKNGTKMSYLGILSGRFEKLLLYLKSAPSNLSKWKVWCENKNPK